MSSLPFVFGVLVVLSFVLSFFYVLIQWIFRKQRRLVGVIIIHIYLLSVLCYISLYYSDTRGSLVCYCPNTIASSKTSDLTIIMASTSSKFIINQSAIIDLFITNKTLPAPTPSNATSTQITSAGTPDVSIQNAFGPDYEVFATAQLRGSSFEIDPRQQTQQSLDQTEVHFAWTITPKYAGQQQLYVTVTGLWVPKHRGSSITRPMGSVSQDISVEWILSENPFFTIGQNLLLVLLGSMFNIPWIWDIIAKKREKRRAIQASISQDSFSAQIADKPIPPRASQKKKRRR